MFSLLHFWGQFRVIAGPGNCFPASSTLAAWWHLKSGWSFTKFGTTSEAGMRKLWMPVVGVEWASRFIQFIVWDIPYSEGSNWPVFMMSTDHSEAIAAPVPEPKEPVIPMKFQSFWTLGRYAGTHRQSLQRWTSIEQRLWELVASYINGTNCTRRCYS